MDTPLFSSTLDLQLRKILQAFDMKDPAWTLKNSLEVCWEQCPTQKAPVVANKEEVTIHQTARSEKVSSKAGHERQDTQTGFLFSRTSR